MYNENNWNKPDPKQIKEEIEMGVEEYNKKIEEMDKTLEVTEDLLIKERFNGHDFELINTDKILDDVSADEVYTWYSEAMQRRDREPLSKESFIGHFFQDGNIEASLCFGNKEKGYLLGFNKYGTFVPSHFAPKTLRGGYDLFSALGSSENIPAILSITEDLSETLSKMPSWHKLEIEKEIISFFRNKEIKKEIMYNSHPAVKKVMMGLLLEYTNNF